MAQQNVSRKNPKFFKAVSVGTIILTLVGCSSAPQGVSVQTGVAPLDAASHIISGIYTQQKIDQRQTTPSQPKQADPVVQKIDAAIEKARQGGPV